MPRKAPRPEPDEPRPERPRGRKTALLLGVGFDGEDGHRRTTTGRDFVLVGGSADTHERMQEHAIRLNEELDRRGIRLGEVRCADELREIARKAGL